jgi:hypothetical protein
MDIYVAIVDRKRNWKLTISYRYPKVAVMDSRIYNIFVRPVIGARMIDYNGHHAPERVREGER